MHVKKLTLDDQLCFALYAATNAVTRAYRPRLEQIGITYPQYLVLLVLWQDGCSSLGRIATRLNLSPNAVTPLVDRLEHSGLTKRSRDKGDRRVVHIDLTDKGRALETEASLTQQKVACQTGLDPEALDALREELKALVRHMEPDRFDRQQDADGPGQKQRARGRGQ